MLDVRNDYEWDAGHFAGAQRPAEEVFHETPVGEGEADVPAPLAGADPDTPVMVRAARPPGRRRGCRLRGPAHLPKRLC